MEITRITREYSRTDELKRPDGTSVWIKHSATAEAMVSPADVEHLAEVYLVLNQIVIAEVDVKMKEVRKQFKDSFQPASKPANGEPDLSRLPSKL